MTQWHDPIVEEVRRIRELQAAELNYDLKAIFERARRRQKQSRRKTVSFIAVVKPDDRHVSTETAAEATRK
jgi:hypothetical protein